MAPPRDLLRGVIGSRRINVYTVIKRADSKYNNPAELQALLETARASVQQKWCQQEELPKRDVSSNFYQWDIDRTMFECVITYRQFLYSRPDPNQQPYSVEWQAAYDAHQRIVPDPCAPPAVLEARQIKPAPVSLDDSAQEAMTGLDNVALNTGEAASEAPTQNANDRSTEAHQPEEDYGKQVQESVPKEIGQVFPKLAGQTPKTPTPDETGNYTFVYEFTGRALYVMPAQTRDELWSRLFPGVHKFRGCEPFTMMFPPDRNFQACVLKNMRRTDEILDHRFVRLVCGTRQDHHGKPNGRCLTLSVAGHNTNTTDILVLKAMRDGWYQMFKWLNTLVSSPNGADIDMASFLEAEIAKSLHGNDSRLSVGELNNAVSLIDGIVDSK